MKVYVLFEKKAFLDGDCIRHISTRQDIIRKKLKHIYKEYLDYSKVENSSISDESADVYYKDGEFVSLEIQIHNVDKGGKLNVN